MHILSCTKYCTIKIIDPSYNSSFICTWIRKFSHSHADVFCVFCQAKFLKWITAVRYKYMDLCVQELCMLASCRFMYEKYFVLRRAMLYLHIHYKQTNNFVKLVWFAIFKWFRKHHNDANQIRQIYLCRNTADYKMYYLVMVS